jgi:uncharacterized protein YciI
MQRLLFLFTLFGFLSGQPQSKSYMFVFLHSKPSTPALAKDTVEKLMKGHLENIERLAKEGKLLAAGPFEGGGGLFILNTDSKAEGWEWLKTDPGIQADRWEVEMLPYVPRKGGVCQVKEPYQMVTYDFIRFSETPDASEKVMEEHHQLVDKEAEKGNVITLGGFEPSGYILILKKDVMDKFLESSAAVKGGIIRAEKKKLWIAKGSFCEM